MTSTNALEPGNKKCVSGHRWTRWLVLLTWCLVPMAAPAQEAAKSAAASVPHLEECTEWGFRNDRLAITNNCKVPVAISVLLLRSTTMAQGDVSPGQHFYTGMGRTEADGGWMYTVCPADHVPDVAVAMKNRGLISSGKYACIKQ